MKSSPLRIAIVNAVYPPEPVASAHIGRDLARRLAGDGARVTVLCPFPTRPMGVEFPGYTGHRVARVDLEDGVEVVRLPSFTAPGPGLAGRLRENLSFGSQACRYLAREVPQADVIYANPWPLFSQAMIARHCARRGIPLVLHVQDVYPEALRSKLPVLVQGGAFLALTALDRWSLRRATRVVVISENMRRTCVDNRGLVPERVVTIPNWVDERLFASLPSRAEACARYGLPEEKFTFLYLGNIGPVAGVDLLIAAFRAARLPQAQLVIAGDGSAKAACVEMAKDLGVESARFISSPDVENVPLRQSLGHAFLLPLRKGAAMSSIPSKLASYLLSGRPILASVDDGSDTARCIREAKCGWVGEPEDVGWLARQMAEAAALPADTLARMGANGREYGLKHFSRAQGVEQLASVVREAARQAVYI